MKKIFWLLAIGALMHVNGNLIGTSVAENIPEEILVFATPENEGAFTQYLRDVLKEVSTRTGIECALKELPKKRCLVGADSGRYAGVAARIPGLETEYPNLKMIGVSHFTVQHIVFAKRQHIIETVHDIKSLTDHAMKTGYTVAFLRGSKKAQHLLSGLPEENTYALNNPEKGFKLLDLDRIGAYLAGPGIVNRALFKEQFHHSDIQEVCVVSETQLFPYVHVTYASIIPILEEVLQSMVDDGTLDRIRKSLE